MVKVAGAICLALAGFLALVSPALADPCEAISENGPMPARLGFGSSFSGPVAVVIDGDSMCVAVGAGPENLVEVRLADYFAPESGQSGGSRAKAALERIALGRQATCVANLRTYDRIAARCRIDGRPVGDLMRQAGVAEGGSGTDYGTAPRATTPRAFAPVSAGAFRSCAAARAAGAAPMRRGQPGYNPNLDGDHDGIACEPYRGR